MIDHPNARFVDNVHPLARHMAPLAERAFLDGDFVDTAYFEPFYLKNFKPLCPKSSFERRPPHAIQHAKSARAHESLRP